MSNSIDFSIIAAFRSLRMFRIFKLARTWTSLRNILEAMSLSLNGVAYFSIIVLLFIVVASLLGMEFFAYNVKNDDGNIPRINFNDFI